MFLKRIETTVSVMGFVVYLTYFVTVEKAVEWRLNLDWYGDSGDNMVVGPGIEILDSLLRTHWSGFIGDKLLKEFELRMYEEDAKLAAQADMEDLKF